MKESKPTKDIVASNASNPISKSVRVLCHLQYNKKEE